MALGKFTDANLATTAALSGGTWSGVLPLANLQTESRYLSRPARQATPGDLSKSRFDAQLERPRMVTVIGVLFHSMSLEARYRVSLAGPTTSLDTPLFRSEWRPVYGRLFPSEQLAWETPNWWTGTPLEGDLSLYPRHLWIPLPPALVVSAVRLEFDDHLNPAGYFDIGGLWIAPAWSPKFNFDRGRELGMAARDQLDESPSGRVFGEERTPRRRVTVTWSGLSKNEALRLFDAGARARTTRTVLFVPDVDDEISLAREAFPATFEAPPSARFSFEHQHFVTATFKEVLA